MTIIPITGVAILPTRVIESDLLQFIHLCMWRKLLVASNHTLFESDDARTSSVQAPSITVSLKLVAFTLRLRGVVLSGKKRAAAHRRPVMIVAPVGERAPDGSLLSL